MMASHFFALLLLSFFHLFFLFYSITNKPINLFAHLPTPTLIRLTVVFSPISDTILFAAPGFHTI
ncbi:MAG: hypothetical protein JOS17DRAFT_762075 [Linnemannia elongata]|nr:MAG: hypothetical protein JOS17DRAFT_762075 [Linnemannia elongata]